MEKYFFMIKRILFLVFLAPFLLHSQYSIQGKIDQGENFSWVLLYKIKDGKQIYIDNADVDNSNFEFTISENEDPGIYRVFYQIEDQLYIEFIYNKENIDFIFNPNHPIESLKFNHSDENILYQDYFKSIGSEQKYLDSLQVEFFSSNDKKLNKKITKSYQNKLREIKGIQEDFEKQSEGKLAYYFIKASKQFNVENPIKVPVDYLNEVKKYFFDAFDLNDSILNKSTFINDKIVDYIFYLNQSNDREALNEMQKNSINISLSKLSNSLLKKNIEESILNRYAEEQNDEMVNFMLDNHYNKLPNYLQDYGFRNHMLSEVKTAVGKKSPDVVWQENGVLKSLYKANDSNIYIIVFFSSGCLHCQKEMPEFYKFIESTSNIKVITIGLEDEKTDWENMVKDYTNFINILDLDKWDSPRVEDFGISAIPNYFILNKDKNIIAKPEDLEELKGYFE